ncbi:gluconate 2-dehydrogenase subunit 3 family protein [Pedobacter cryoconitis]|uniref:Gluconate 2-dehydrogenase subunit 3-like protein n=1 Tax=Pedobacter cryoconitis TaxID=188932 RepID=A0A327T7Z6_9SPHI|nr:gluconate 2-dehydrogenase subunit 3 family protein [Pedobacter cryoconitis]RAJ37318.1 gluconate 2-dehydrogenase subunit 3-like protein [Pedobacter cryoconitis]
MKRRDALKNVALLLGGAISATTMGVLFKSCTNPQESGEQINFSPEDRKLLADFADIVIPATKDSAGAKLAGLGEFIPMMITDCYPEKERSAFYKGMQEFRQKAISDYKKDFSAMTVEEKNHYVGSIREMVILQSTNSTDGLSPLKTFFILGRDLTLIGYFSSEIGCTQARAYVQVPGRYDGSAVLKPGQKSWAT